MDDSGSGNMINFNISPVRKFVPLVPLPAEPAFVSLECSPFDKSGSASSSEDPFELVLRSIAKAKTPACCEEVQEEKKGGQVREPLKINRQTNEGETSYVARVVPTGQSKSLLQALAIEGVGNFTCDEDITCIMDISDPTGGDSTSELLKSSVMAEDLFKLDDGLQRLSASIGGHKESMTPDRDITSLVNEKLNSCIQMMLNGSCSKQQRDGSSTARHLHSSLIDLKSAGGAAGGQSHNGKPSLMRRSLDVSLDGVVNHLQKAPSHHSDGTEMSSLMPGSNGTVSFLNRAFLRNVSSDPPTQSSGSSLDSGVSNVVTLGCSSAVTSVLVRRWLESTDGRMRALSCDTDFTPRATSGELPSPAHSAVVLNSSSLSSVFSPPLLDMHDSVIGGESTHTPSSQEQEQLSSEDQLAHEALTVAHNISTRAVGDSTLDDIRVELYSSDEDNEEYLSSFQTHKHFQLYEPALEPLPLDMGRVSSMSLQRSPALPPPLLDHCNLVTRLKQLKAANQLPDKKLGPLKAVIPLGDMSKAAGINVCVLSSAHKTSEALLSSLIYEGTAAGGEQQATLNSSKQKDTSTLGSKSKLKKGLKLPPKPRAPPVHQSPVSSGSSRKSNLTGSSGSLVTSTPIRSDAQDTAFSHAFPSVTPLAAGRQSSRNASNSPKSSKENGGKKYSDTAGSRRSRSLSVTPMKSVENQLVGARGGGRKPLSLGKVVSHTKKFARAARDKENIIPVLK